MKQIIIDSIRKARHEEALNLLFEHSKFHKNEDWLKRVVVLSAEYNLISQNSRMKFKTRIMLLNRISFQAVDCALEFEYDEEYVNS